MHSLSRSVIERSPVRIRPGVELMVRTVDDSFSDRLPGLAAEVAFFVILSLPPLLLTVIASVGFVDELLPNVEVRDELTTTVINLSGNVFTAETVGDVIEPFVTQIASQGRGDIIAVGFLFTLYSASRAVKVVLTAITIAYDLEETRPGYLQRVWGLGLTFAGMILAPLLVPLLIVGPGFGQQLADWLGTDPGLSVTWRLGYWPGVGLLATLLLAAFYHLGAPWKTPLHRDFPGAALAMVVWLAGSVGLRYYAQQFLLGERSIYGPIAGPLVLLIWLYISAFAVLLGAELNAEVEKLWPKRPELHRGSDDMPRPVAPTARQGTS